MMDFVKVYKGYEVVTPFCHLDAFKFNAEKGWVWLQKLCFWILRRIGCFYDGETHQIKAVQIDKNDVLDNVKEQIMDKIKWGYTYDQLEIFMGRDHIRNIKDDMGMNMHIRVGPQDGNPTLMGVPVTVVPWMEGVLAVPTRGIK